MCHADVTWHRSDDPDVVEDEDGAMDVADDGVVMLQLEPEGQPSAFLPTALGIFLGTPLWISFCE
jgi:hypothetical protein